MMHYGGWGWGWAMVCMVAFIAFVALVAWAIIASTNRRDTTTKQGDDSSDAMSVLDRRYASGDIDESEYQRRRHLLTQH
jgi:putative membrane protein